LKTTVLAAIDDAAEGRQWGLFGQPRVNVLKLNLMLDNEQAAQPNDEEESQ
jgi:potassium-transporting ATPase KdpC subunit